LFKIGLKVLPYIDTQRSHWGGRGSRPMITDIWYPANDLAKEQEIFIGPPGAPLFFAGRAAPEAEITSDRESFPLIMLSHGTGGTARQQAWLAEALCRYGYIVAGVNHHGNTALEPYNLKGILNVWERPRDLSAVLNQLLVDPVFGARINCEQIGAVGFSLGGYTVISVAGGVLDLSMLKRAYYAPGRDFHSEIPSEFPDKAALMTQFDFLADHDQEHKQSFCDERIRAVFAIAPVLGEAFDAQGLAPVKIPVKIVVGEADTLAPPRYNAARFAELIPQTELELLEGAVAHYTFLSESTALGRETLPLFCIDPPGVDRRAIHQKVGEWARKFFDEHVKTG